MYTDILQKYQLFIIIRQVIEELTCKTYIYSIYVHMCMHSGLYYVCIVNICLVTGY